MKKLPLLLFITGLLVFNAAAGSVSAQLQQAAQAEAQVCPEEADAQVAIIEVVPNKSELELYEKLELSIELEAPFKNPFDPAEVDIYCELTSPDKEKIKVGGFLYSACTENTSSRLRGNRITDTSWMVRFAPYKAGTWKYKLYLKTPYGSVESEEQEFVCTRADKAGFIRVSPIDNRYFEFDSGEFYYPIGENISWARLSGFEKYYRRLHEAGGNWSRLWMASWEVALEWTGGPYDGIGYYNLKKAAKLDKIMELAETNGIYLQLVLNHHGQLSTRVNPQWHENPYNRKNGGPCEEPQDFFTDPEAKRLFKNRLRYIVARWGHSTSLMAWELWNELTFIDNYDHEVDAAWHKEMCAYINEIDPYKHLVTTSYAGTVYEVSYNPAVWALEDIDFTQYHMYTPDIVALTRGAWFMMKRFDKPYFLAEFGRGSADGVDEEDELARNLHAGLWAQLMTPSAGNAMCWWWDTYIDPLDLYYQFSAVSSYADGLDRRLKNFKLKAAALSGRKNNQTIKLYAQGILNTQEAYIWIYDPDWTQYQPDFTEAAEVRGVKLNIIGMSRGDYILEFWNTYTGKITGVEKLSLDRDITEIELPAFKKDMALKLKPAYIKEVALSGEPEIRGPAARRTEAKTNLAAGSAGRPEKEELKAFRLKGSITVDGSFDEWPELKAGEEGRIKLSPKNGFVSRGEITDETDASLDLVIAHDEDYIYIAAEIRDDSLTGSEKGIDIWRDDCLEIWFDTRDSATELNNMPFNPYCYQINISPLTEGRETAEVYVYRNFNIPLVIQNTTAASEIIDGGYRLEAAIKKEALFGLDTDEQPLVGFNVSLVDRDKVDNKWSHLIYAGEAEADATTWVNLYFK